MAARSAPRHHGGMAGHIIIDGNNLLYAVHEHAVQRQIGRERLVRLVEAWARRVENRVTLVFDGPVPKGGLAGQLSSKRIDVRFSASHTADDVIVAMIEQSTDPGKLRVVTGDKAIAKVAAYRRCHCTPPIDFAAELEPPRADRKPQRGDSRNPAEESGPHEKPDDHGTNDGTEWLDAFGYDDTDDEPFDGHDAMVN